jgi:dTDP-4-amino-4,6-dideoxygalactose transaminase
LILNNDNKFPGADFITSNQICLPLYPGLKRHEILYIINTLKDLLVKY